MMKRWIKIALCVLLLVVILSGALLANYLIALQAYRHAIEAITYTRTDASGLSDGVYTGDCDARFIYAKVEVTVENHAMTDIALLEYRHHRGADAVHMIPAMLDAQRLDVDVVAGATSSCKVIRKAVDNALSGAAALVSAARLC